MLLVTTTMRVVHGIHGHTTHLGPLVTLGTVLVEGTASLQHGLVRTSTTSHQTHHRTTSVGNGLLAAGRQANTCSGLLAVLGNNQSVSSGGTGELAAVSRLGLDVADDGTLGDGAHREDVANGQLRY